MFTNVLRRKLKIAFRESAEIINPLWFFLIVITLFPLGIGPEPKLLARIASGIVWVAALLSSFLTLERLFRDDYLDGTLEQLLLLPSPLALTVVGKVCALWVVTGLPLLLLSPLIALLLSLDFETWKAVALTLLLGTPTLSFIGAIGAARQDSRMMAMARPLAYGMFACITLAFIILVHAFVVNDFTVAYVANNSNPHLQVYYRVAATWDAHEGSLLLWVLLLSCWTLAVALFSRRMQSRACWQ